MRQSGSYQPGMKLKTLNYMVLTGVNQNIVEVEPPNCPSPVEYLYQLQDHVNPLQHSNNYGVEIFTQAKSFINELFE